ncbi:right-handed parallel beta-helix repeat-containing protein [Bacillus salipaludis]|uniref:Right-handed parallel beta-helix repeat-containing protein n=1 Tax=Bacillus salipaludis TaxID=2547811 RepID=A0AA90R1R8_9BACI|nr:right-handed parallel beta-helix repeat-containing protein [Bacillus salipaludis]MDQ6595001.1 right-handed parallel beta-helix repeat-containing protein [Bacillus salipaludis]
MNRRNFIILLLILAFFFGYTIHKKISEKIDAVPSQLAYMINHKKEISVKSFGAKGDCVLDSNGNYESGTDDTQAFIKAIKAVPAGGVLLVPPGKYYISSINLNRGNITISGYGATLVTSIDVSTGSNVFQLEGDNISLIGLRLMTATPFNVDTTTKAPSSAGGLMIRLGSTTAFHSNILVRDVTTNGGFGGIDIQRSSNVRVINCHVINAIGNGINFANCPKDIWCEGNTVQNTRDDSIICVCDVSFTQGTENWIVRNNKVEKSYAKGIGSSGVSSAIIANNNIKNTWSAGILIFQDTYYKLAKSQNVKIKGNTIIDAGKNFGPDQFKITVSTSNDGVYVYNDTKNVEVIDNSIISPSRFGINIGNGAKAVKIGNNEILATGSTGISIGDANNTSYNSALDITLTDNTIIDTQGHGISIGGVNGAHITRNKVKSWLDGSRSIYIKNAQNMLVAENTSNNKITSVWSPNHYYFAGQYIVPATFNGHAYKCIISGLSGSTEPSWNIAGGKNKDGGVAWFDYGKKITRGIPGTPYVDGNGSSVDVQVTTDNHSLNN